MVSNAKPEIANYPFTTTVPNLGIAKVSDEKSLLIADIPGLIEGASKGKGLGDEFLRHVERTKVLIHLVDAYSNDPLNDYKIIRKELSAYSKDLAKRPEIVVLSKTEGLDDEIIAHTLDLLKPELKKGTKLMVISSKTKAGLSQLLFEAAKQVDKITKKASEKPEDALPVISLTTTENSWHVTQAEEGFLIKGKNIERFAAQTDFSNFAGVDRLRDILRKQGIMHELERSKIKPNDKIFFGDKHYGPIKY